MSELAALVGSSDLLFELILGQMGLLKDALQCSGCHFLMHGHNAACGAVRGDFFKCRMAASLADLLEPQPL